MSALDRITAMFSTSQITFITDTLPQLRQLVDLAKRHKGRSRTKVVNSKGYTTIRWKDNFPDYFHQRDYDEFIKEVKALNLERTDNHAA